MERRWGFLAPWCAVLRRHITFRNLNDMMEVWSTSHSLEVSLPRRDDPEDEDSDSDDFDADYWENRHKKQQEKFVKAREALALLAAVKRVDRSAWKYLLSQHCEVDIGVDGEEKFEQIPASFLVTMDFTRQNRTLDEAPEFALVRLCGVEQRERPSAEYLTALQQIAAQDPSLADQPGVDLEIPVKVHFPGATQEYAEPLRNLMDIGLAERAIKAQWEEYEKSSTREEVAPGAIRCTLVLEPMIANFLMYDNTTSSEMAETLERLMLDGVQFSKILSLSLEEDHELDDERANRKALGQLMRRVFSSDHGAVSRDRRAQVGAVEVYGAAELTSDAYFEAMCSAVVLNQMTKKLFLCLDESPDEPVSSALWYKWMAYAVFSRRANALSCTETVLMMIGSLSMRDAEAFASIVSSEHPEEEICGRPHGKIDERDATLRGGAPIRWKFSDSGEPVANAHALTIPFPMSSIRTFSDDGSSEWVDAVIPGFGRCQVRRGDLTFHSSNAREKVGPKRMALTIGFPGWSPFDTTGIPALVASIGSSLKALTLWHSRVDVDENEILRSCPHLEELSLCGGLLDVQLDFSEYRRLQSPPELPRTDWHDIAALAATLSDWDNPIAKCLRRLRVRLTNQWNGWVKVPEGYDTRGFEQDLRPILQILEANKRLEYFELIVRKSSNYDQYMGDFRKYHLKAIPRARERLPMSSKLALLSVSSPQRIPESNSKRTRPSRGPLRELNAEAFRHIFEYAAQPVIREAYFSTERDGAGWNDDGGIAF